MILFSELEEEKNEQKKNKSESVKVVDVEWIQSQFQFVVDRMDL